MMVLVPVGFPDNYLVRCYRIRGLHMLTMAQNLPSQVLCGFGARQVDEIHCHL